jgi:ubiquinone/menaquinone biosynthesis C-methylase UbiE
MRQDTMLKTPEAAHYDRSLWLLEHFTLRRLRQQLLQQVEGRVLEIGVGTGANLPLYADTRLVTGIDVHRGRLAGAQFRQTSSPFVASCADAQHLPFAAHIFDTVISTLVFCCIPVPEQALNEIKRVLRPGGRLLLLEHVRGQGPISRRLTDWLHPLWFALQGECHLNRETARSVANAGFHISQKSRHGWGVLQMIQATSG